MPNQKQTWALFSATAGGEAAPEPSWDNEYSLEFDGVDDYVETSATFDLLDGLTNFAFSFWFKTSNFSYKQLFWIDGASGTTNYAQTQLVVRPNYLIWYFNNNSYYVYGNNTLVADTWYHCLLTRDASRATGDKARMYINGVNESASDSSVGLTTLESSSSGLKMGDGDFRGYYSGNIDEFAVYNQDMAAYIAELWDGSGNPTDLINLATAPNPNAWYRMGDSGTFFASEWDIPDQMKIDNWSSYSMAFDGVDDEINCGANTSLQPTSGITLSCWFMIPTGSLHYGADTLISQDHVPYGGLYKGYYLDVTIAANGYLYSAFGLGDGSSETRVVANTNSGGTPPYVGDTWYHFCGTWDGSDMVTYINGVLLGTTAFTGPIAYDATEETWIGNRGHNQNIYFVGSIDDVSIWNTGKSASEVLAIYNNGKPKNESETANLVGYWRMGEGATFSTNWTVPDDSTNSNDGISANMDEVDKINNAPDNTAQGRSVNMDEVDRVTDVPT